MATIFISPSSPKQTSSMAINLCPDSPRISFSYDLDHSNTSSYDHVPRSDQDLSDFDFDFGFCEVGQEASPADELFFNGVILPTQLKNINRTILDRPLLPEASRKEEEEEEEEEVTALTKASLVRESNSNSNSNSNTNSRSFWRFMRSSSLNSDDTRSKKGSIWSTLPLLARSYSTGLRSNSAKNSSKPPLKKVQFGKNGSSSNPVLNVPPPYITKGTSDLLGFGSLFRNGNEKKGKKP